MIFWNKKKKPSIVINEEVLLEATKRVLTDFLLDSNLNESQQLGTLLGLPPLDDPEARQEASAERVNEASHLLPLMNLFASAMSEGVIAYLRTMTDMEIDDEEAAEMTDLLHRVSLSTSLGTVCQLESLGYIHYPHWSN